MVSTSTTSSSFLLTILEVLGFLLLLLRLLLFVLFLLLVSLGCLISVTLTLASLRCVYGLVFVLALEVVGSFVVLLSPRLVCRCCVRVPFSCVFALCAHLSLSTHTLGK